MIGERNRGDPTKVTPMSEAITASAPISADAAGSVAEELLTADLTALAYLVSPKIPRSAPLSSVWPEDRGGCWPVGVYYSLAFFGSVAMWVGLIAAAYWAGRSTGFIS